MCQYVHRCFGSARWIRVRMPPEGDLHSIDSHARRPEHNKNPLFMFSRRVFIVRASGVLFFRASAERRES